ncbi:MAG: hypothetical protein WCZ28_15555 [Burkholderiaceae bacterium]
MSAWTRRRTLAAAGAMAVSAAACGVRIGRFELRYGTIDESLDSGFVFSITLVARNRTEWISLWQTHEGGHLPSRPLPHVDFGRDIVVGVFLGQRPDRCHQVRIERVLLIDDSGIIVRYREVVSRWGTACAPALSHPAAIVRIPFTGLPVRFEQLSTRYFD